MNNNTPNSKHGITLIALIITVIILLILAGTAISIAINGGDIFGKAAQARNAWNEAVAREESAIKDLLKYLDNPQYVESIDFEAKKAEALANRVGTEEIGIGTDGELVDMSLWTYEIYDNNTKARLGIFQPYINSADGGYLGSIINGQIEGKIPQYIMPEGDTNYYPVIDISNLFAEKNGLVIPPQIPSTVENMYSTFRRCSSLQTAPVIPDGVTNMKQTFDECRSLQMAPIIPDGVTNMERTFGGCSSLQTAPVIPNSVTSLFETFSFCTNLQTIPALPNSIINMKDTFRRLLKHRNSSSNTK